MNTITLNGQESSKNGKSAAKTYRNTGLVPCVLYSKGENIQFNATPADLRHIIYTPDFKVVDVVLNGVTHQCILKELQFHPVTDTVIHIDFLKLVKGETIRIEVPLRITGNAAGVKTGGKLLQKLRNVKCKTTPEKMVTEVTLDVTNLEVGQTMRIRDIKTIEGVEFINTQATPVVSVEVTRALKSAAAETAAAAAKGGKK
ncbi:MAG: 50S ribosomal protein L25 [Saprospiraceae bacterium]|nr:50S ribosomal protein L25 [Saprospiraceae bacterium]